MYDNCKTIMTIYAFNWFPVTNIYLSFAPFVRYEQLKSAVIYNIGSDNSLFSCSSAFLNSGSSNEAIVKHQIEFIIFPLLLTVILTFFQ